jgi:hypothetical protein
MQDVVDRSRAEPWKPGRQCAMCLSVDPELSYYPDRWIPGVCYCEPCWERSELQQRMVDLGLEQNPEVEN